MDKEHRRVYEIPLKESNEILMQRYLVSILPITSREGREALYIIKLSLIKAIQNARANTNVSACMFWEESDYEGFGSVSEERVFRNDDDEDVDDDEGEDVPV